MNSSCPQPVEHLTETKNRLFGLSFGKIEDQKVKIGQYVFSFEDNSCEDISCEDKGYQSEKSHQAVQPKVMELVKLLSDERGNIVSREKIEAVLWPQMLVGLDSVNNTVARLRRLLGDNPKSPKYIETIPRIGYRLKLQRSSSKSIKFDIVMPSKIGLASLALSVTGLVLFLSLGFNFNSTPTDHVTLHRDPVFQKAMLAKEMSVDELLQDYDIILKIKK